MREEILKKIREERLICIVRGVYGEDCLKLAEALHAGGICLMEVTFDQSRPEARDKTAETIRLLQEKLGREMAFGAGTVTSREMLDMTKQAGGQFVISPDVNEEIIRGTRALGMVSIPGALTPTEVMKAYRAGADYVKIFPADTMGPAYIKALKAPLSHIPMLAVGGVNAQNLPDFLAAGAAGAGVGGNLVNKAWIAAGEFDKITACARSFTEAVRQSKRI